MWQLVPFHLLALLESSGADGRHERVGLRVLAYHPEGLDMAVLVLLNGFLACVFAESAYHKLRDMGAFGAALADYRLLRARPGARRVARAATPAVELVLAGALLTPAVATAATYPLAHVALELPLIMHIHEVERRHLPERVRQARRVYGLDGDAVAERQPGR